MKIFADLEGARRAVNWRGNLRRRQKKSIELFTDEGHGGKSHTQKPMPAVIKKEYLAHLDSKNRFTLRGAKARLYNVKVFEDGHLLLSPQKLVEDPPISRETMLQIERSIGNLKAGKAAGPIDIKAARKLFKL